MEETSERECSAIFSSGTEGMEFTGERYVPGVRGQIQFEHLHRYMLAIRYAAGRDVLDIACGEGYGAAALARSARSVLGVDIAEEAVTHAKGRYEADNLRFVQGSLSAIPSEDASSDLIVCLETLEHISDHERALQELHRVLRPDGMLLISTPNREAKDGAWHDKNPYHQKELSEAEFRDLLASRFRNVAVLEQRFLHGSVINCEKGLTGTSELLNSEDFSSFYASSGHIGKFYFIALASNSPLPEAPRLSVLDGFPDLKRWNDQFTYAVNTMHAREEELAKLQAERVTAEEEISKMEDTISRLQSDLRTAKTNIDLQKVQIDFLRNKVRKHTA